MKDKIIRYEVTGVTKVFEDPYYAFGINLWKGELL